MAAGEGGRSVRAGIDAYPVEFSGTGGEYFRVWIVNLLLNVVTLGLYTPVARRRTARWFYGHTRVAGNPLEFTAPQGKMVIGFLLLVLLYVAFQVAAETGQTATTALMMLGGAALAPYFWGGAMRFRLNSTRWRGIRLQFTAGWLEIYRAAWPLFVIALVWTCATTFLSQMAGTDARGRPTLPPAAPAIAIVVLSFVLTVACAMRLEFNARSLLVRRGRIGGQDGRWKPVFSDFVRIWLATIGVFLVGVLVAMLLGVALVGGSFAALRPRQSGGFGFMLAMLGFALVAFFLLLLASGPARAYREARVFRLTWSNIGVSQLARFKSKLRVRSYVLLRVRNLALTLLTLGFFRPFALVSEYRMKCESVTLHVKGSLDQLAGQLAREEEGLGDAIAAAAGLDLVT